MCSICCVSHRVGHLMRQGVCLCSFKPSAVVGLHAVYDGCSFTGARPPTTLTKEADVHLLQGVNAAELIEFVVNLVEY